MKKYKFLGLVILLALPLTGYSQKFYTGIGFRPFVSLPVIDLKDDYIFSDYNWRMYEVHKHKQSSMNMAFAIGPSFTLDLFKINISSAFLYSFRSYKFTTYNLETKFDFQENTSSFGESLIELPSTLGITLLAGKPVNLFLEGGYNYNIVLLQSEDEPLLTGGDIYKGYLFDGQNYSEVLFGIGIRMGNKFLTLRKYRRNTSLNNGNTFYQYWTLHFNMNFKSKKYSKHYINL